MRSKRIERALGGVLPNIDFVNICAARPANVLKKIHISQITYFEAEFVPQTPPLIGGKVMVICEP